MQHLKLLAALFLVGCALTPSGVRWGADVIAEGSDIREAVEIAAGEQGWSQLSAEAIQSIVDEVVRRRVELGATQEDAESMPLGWRELIEAVIGSGFLINWLRNQKYNIIRTPKGESKA